jgi:hypothetical protein
MIRHAALALFAAGALAACAPRGAPADGSNPPATAAQAAACREVYGRQNRADIYNADSEAGGSRDAAFSGAVPANMSARLSARFARDRLYDDCLHGASGNVGSAPDAVPPVAISPAAAKP